MCVTTLKQRLQIKFALSVSHSALTIDRLVMAVTLSYKASDKVASGGL